VRVKLDTLWNRFIHQVIVSITGIYVECVLLIKQTSNIG